MALTKAESAALYRKRHPEKVAAYFATDKAKANAARRQAAYRKRHPERIAAYAKSEAAKAVAARCRAKPEHKARIKAWVEANKDRLKERKRAYYLANKKMFVKKAKQWAKKNPERAKELRKKVLEKRRGADVARHRAREANKRHAVPSWANKFFVDEIYDLALRRTIITGIKWEVDHIVPLKSKLVCGLHCENNLAVITKAENIRKSNTYWPDMP